MNTFIIKVDNGKGAWDAFPRQPETMRILPLGSTALAFWKARGVPEQPDVQAAPGARGRGSSSSKGKGA